MSDWDAVSWPLRGESLSSEVLGVLLGRADDDARELGFDAQRYRQWIEAVRSDDAQTGQLRASLADSALEATSLPQHVEALLRVSQARRLQDPALAERLTAWTEAELRITTVVAQARFDDPTSQRNRLAMLGKAAGTLGHELRNPMGVIQSSLYLLQRRAPSDEKTGRHIEKIGRQVENCHRIIEDLMHLARNAPPRLESLDVREAFSLALEEAALPSAMRGLIETPSGLRVDADPGLLQRVLVNLLRNANTAMRGEGVLRLGATESSDALVLWVRDQGPGFEAQLLRDAFDPLSTTSGIGLGLALVDSVARRHGGQASAENLSDGGARVCVHFPRAQQQP
ncbi:MAG: sensor histidine kinase [Nannocystales bacterium]